MGLDIHARLVVGFKVTFKIQEVDVVKYDENTGKPYTKKERKQVSSHPKLTIVDEVSDFSFGYPDEESEYTAIRGKSIYYSKSNRFIKDPFEMFEEIDLTFISKEMLDLSCKYPKEVVKAYFYADPSW